MPKVRIPKRVAGVKLPKKVRKRAKKALKMADSPALRGLAAAAIDAAAQARDRHRSEDEPDKPWAPHFVGETNVRIDGSKVGEAFRTAAIDGLRRFLEGFEEGLRDAAIPAEASSTEPGGGVPPIPPRPGRPARPSRPPRPPRPPRSSRPGRPSADAAPE